VLDVLGLNELVSAGEPVWEDHTRALTPR
jgi:hypothetical protein